MNIWDSLKADAINKNVLLFVALVSLGLAGWMMASRKETLQQLQTLQVAHDGALVRIKELTDKLTEKDLEVEKVAKLSAEEAVKKIINIPELDKVLGIKASSSVSENSSAASTNAPSQDQTVPAGETQSSSTSNEIPAAENSVSALPSSNENTGTDLATAPPSPSAEQGSTPSQSASQSPANDTGPSPLVPLEGANVPSQTGSVENSSSSSENQNAP